MVTIFEPLALRVEAFAREQRDASTSIAECLRHEGRKRRALLVEAAARELDIEIAGIFEGLRQGEWAIGIKELMKHVRSKRSESWDVFGSFLVDFSRFAAEHSEDPALATLAIKRFGTRKSPQWVALKEEWEACMALACTQRPIEQEEVDILVSWASIVNQQDATTALIARGLAPSLAAQEALLKRDAAGKSPRSNGELMVLLGFVPKWEAVRLRETLADVSRTALRRLHSVSKVEGPDSFRLEQLRARAWS